jgi:enoyl-CoA hydratase/carnithine racemase
MPFIEVTKADGLTTLRLCRGKVNALNLSVVEELAGHLAALAHDPETRAVILTGTGKFFSFGFDLPEFLPWSREQFIAYATAFTGLYRTIFAYPKPVVAALNGHTVAGGCMLAIACDHRVMAAGKAKISLNELTFGASVFAGAAEMLRFLIGGAKATQVLYSGAMYTADEAHALGFVEDVVSEADVLAKAYAVAAPLAAANPPAFAGIKALLRRDALAVMAAREAESIVAFTEIWYSPFTRAKLAEIPIR